MVSQIEAERIVRKPPKLGVGVIAERGGKIAMGLRQYKAEAYGRCQAGRSIPSSRLCAVVKEN